MYKLFILLDCGLYLFEWKVLSDCLYDEVSCDDYTCLSGRFSVIASMTRSAVMIIPV